MQDICGIKTTSDQPLTFDAAKAYVSRGWWVFPADLTNLPVKKSYKSKAHSNGQNWGKTLDPEQIQRDLVRWPKAGIGIATGAESGIFVVEADTPVGHDVDGIASVKALEAKHGPLPDTLMAESPTGSKHWYFKHPGPKVWCSASQIATGVDVRGDGGMVIAPPSITAKGSYRWLNDAPVADAPQWLIDSVTADTKNDNVVIFPTPPDWLRQLMECKPELAGLGTSTDADDILQKATVEEIKAALAVIPANCSEDEWYRIAAALYDHLGEEGCPIFHEWSATGGTSYKGERDCRNKWRHSASKKDIHIATLFHFANEYDPCWRDGVESEPDPKEADPTDAKPRNLDAQVAHPRRGRISRSSGESFEPSSLTPRAIRWRSSFNSSSRSAARPGGCCTSSGRARGTTPTCSPRSSATRPWLGRGRRSVGLST